MITRPLLLVCDIDGTMTGDDDARERLSALLQELRSSGDHQVLLCYNSGNGVDRMARMCARGELPWPDHYVGNIGTAIYPFPDGGQEAVLDRQWEHLMEETGFKEEAVDAAVALATQRVLGVAPMPMPTSAPTPGEPMGVRALGNGTAGGDSRFYSGLFINTLDIGEKSAVLVAALAEELQAAGMLCLLNPQTGMAVAPVSAGDSFLIEVCPESAGKGKGLTRLRESLGFREEDTLVCGDGGNDIPMFYDAGRELACIVANAAVGLREKLQSEERPNTFMATRASAGGVMEAIEHWGFLSAAAGSLAVDARL